MVYIGEVFIEVAELIASFAKSRGKKVIFRPGQTIITFDQEKVKGILRNVDVLILNSRGWELMKSDSNSTDGDFLKFGPEAVMVTKGAAGCETYTKDGKFVTPAFAVEAVDSTGAGDAFSAGLISAILERKSLMDAVRYALAVSAIKVMKKGPRGGPPTRFEVEEFIKSKTV